MNNEVYRRLRRPVQSLGLITLVLLLIVPEVLQAGDHWRSGVTITAPSRSVTMMSARQAASEGLAGVMKTGATTVFDITISLEADPQGDNDWTNEDGGADVDQRAYEERIEEFARAVYQSTNGAHKIGMVTIYRKGALSNSVDVLWNEDCPDDEGPRSNLSGFGVSGERIWMCTHWTGSSVMSTPKGGGYTLAHEWGHYAYGLYDEYVAEQCDPADIAADACWEGTPRGTDTPAIPAIMNDQWNAVFGKTPAGYTGNPNDFLEFSTENIHPFKSGSTGTNAQKRIFGESAWETLTRDAATDPKFPWLPKRTRYMALTAPTAPHWIVKDDDSTALSELEIHWVDDQLVDISLDVSGSMEGAPLANAKTGARLFIDQLHSGTAFGVSSFAKNAVRDFPVSVISDPDTGVKKAAGAKINALRTGGATSLYDGLMLSLDDLQSFDPDRTGVVYLLSDGEDNDSTATESRVISAYKAARVPIIALAYGDFAPKGTLLKMAHATGGAFFESPTTLPEMQTALLSAEAKFSDNVLVASAQVSVPAGTTTEIIPMDRSLTQAMINLSYTGAPVDFSFHLLRPDGTDTGAVFICEGATSCSAALDETFFAANGHGDYQVRMVNNIGTPKAVTVLASAMPAAAPAIDIAVGFSSGTVNYPAGMILRATIASGNMGLAGLDVAARVTGPSDASFDVPLLDDGAGADILANDGTYSADISYKDNGIYSAVVTASNAAGTARTSFAGVMLSLREDGTAPSVPPPVFIAENFGRVGTASVTATGITADDHADDPWASDACTVIFDDNIDMAGRIDDAGDIDCFTFVPGSTEGPIVVRVTSLGSGMNPFMTIYDHTGTIQIAQADLFTSESPDSSVVVTVAAEDLDAAGMVVVVQHVDPAAATGTYAVSAGAPLTSDPHPLAVDGGGVQEPVVQDSGGSTCFIDLSCSAFR